MCESCGARVSVSTRGAGKTFACPRCEKKILIPRPLIATVEAVLIEEPPQPKLSVPPAPLNLTVPAMPAPMPGQIVHYHFHAAPSPQPLPSVPAAAQNSQPVINVNVTQSVSTVTSQPQPQPTQAPRQRVLCERCGAETVTDLHIDHFGAWRIPAILICLATFAIPDVGPCLGTLLVIACCVPVKMRTVKCVACGRIDESVVAN